MAKQPLLTSIENTRSEDSRRDFVTETEGMSHANRANFDYLLQNLKTSAPMLLADAIALMVATALAAVLDQQLGSVGCPPTHNQHTQRPMR